MAYVPGMPSSVWNNLSDKQKKETSKAVENRQKEQKKSGTGSSSTTIIPGAPSNVQQQINGGNNSSSGGAKPANIAAIAHTISKAQNPKHQTTPIPTSVPQSVRTQAQVQNDLNNYRQQQNQTNANYIDTLLGEDASKLIKSTNTAQIISDFHKQRDTSSGDKTFKDIAAFDANRIYEVLPTADREQIVRNVQKMRADDARNGTMRYTTSNNRLMKEVYKLIQTYEAEYQQRTLAEMKESRYWENGDVQYVTYATSADYYNMEKRGFDTVYIEDGNGILDYKGGVYTIGRDRLAGVPKDVKTVIVDNDGNWRYIANSGSRASYVEDIRNRQYALTVAYESKFSKLTTAENFTKYKCDQLEKQIKYFDKVANRTRKQEDIDKVQSLLEEYYKFNSYHSAAVNKLVNTSKEFSERYSIFEDAARKYTKWTVEDEERLNNLEQAIKRMDLSHVNSTNIRGIGDSKVAEHYAKKQDTEKSDLAGTLVSEYLELKKRKEAEGYLPVYMNTDAITHMKETEESMKKMVDEYNIWDSTTIHAEKGEDLGLYVKRLIYRDLMGRVTDEEYAEYVRTTDMEQGDWGKWFNMKWGNKGEYFKEDLKGIGNSIAKLVTPFFAAGKDKARAQSEYIKAEELIRSGKLSPTEISELRVKQQGYLEAQNNAYKQARSVMFNNVVSNLSIFDILSVQSTFVAWRMAKHPELYANDPKFKKMQDAYRRALGTNYRGAIDASNMASVMLNMKLGTGSATGNEHIYIDGTDLRHGEGSPWEGEKYGFWASLGVGLGTDLGAIIGFAKTAVSTAVKHGGGKILAKAASDSVAQALVRAGVTQEVAEEFVKSKAFRQALQGDIRKALRKYADEGGEAIENSMKNLLKERADDFKYMFESSTPGAFKEGADGLIHNIDESRYANFLSDAEKSLNGIGDIAERSFLIDKGTVIANTLGDADDLLNDVQMKLFKATCPVAGAVTAIAKGNKWIKSLKNLTAADEDLLRKGLAATQSSLEAKVSKFDWNSCLDTAGFHKLYEQVTNEFAWGVLGTAKRRLAYGKEAFNDAVKRFSQYKDGVMQGIANSYIDNVISKLRTTLDGDDGLIALERLAQENKFESFKDMYATIKDNLELLCKDNPDSRGIIQAFDNLYDTAVTKQTLTDIKKYVKHAEDHLHGMKNALGTEHESILSHLNAEMYPGFVSGEAKVLSDNIHDFLYTANADMMLFTNSSGNLATIHEAGVAAMDALDSVAYGNLSPEAITKATNALDEYINEVQYVYVKNLNDWEADAIQDAFGVQNYLDNIFKIAPNHAGNREAIDIVHDNLMKFFEQRGIHVTDDDISKVLKDNASDFEKMSMTERQSVIYRITENKGTNAVAQIHDANLKIITDALTDCNSQLNKNLRVLQLELEDSARKRISDAIANACAIENTRVISDAMKAGNVDSTMHMAVMDVLSGNSYEINRIIQNYPSSEAAARVTDYVMEEVRKQLALHNGTYSTFRHLAADTVNVETNVLNIEKNLEGVIEPKDDCIDICVSMVRSTDSAAPKDIAFHVRGSADKPTVLRKNTAFSVYDDSFASRVYGKSAAQLTSDYANLGLTGGLSGSEWQRQLKEYIEAQKQIALEQNKTIRFIGFNSSDAISKNNKYLSDVLRSCGVNANTANALDLADVMRTNLGEYIFDSAQIDALTRGLHDAIDRAHSRSLSLGISPVIAYDSKYTCADMIHGVLKRHEYSDELISSHAKYIVEELEKTVKGLGTGEYNKSGLAMGAYLDATAFAQILQDAGQSTIHSNGELMRIITESTVRGDAQLGLHKVIETAMDNEWVDYAKLDPAWFANFETREQIHASILQINRMYNDLHRLDLISEKDVEGLKYIYAELVESIPHKLNSHPFLMTHLFKVDEMSPAQLYTVNKWLMDQAQRLMDPAAYDDMFGKMLFNAREQASYLSDVGYRFIKTNIVDYSDGTLDAFLVKYLDTSEEGFRFAEALNELSELNKQSNNLKNYQEAVEGIFNKNNIHGVEDRMLVMQMANVHSPIIEFQDDVKKIYETAYGAAVQELTEAGYGADMVHRVATERGVRAAKEEIIRQGEHMRSDAVHAVAELNEEAFKTHLIRNCCGGMVIDPTAKCVEGLDLPLLFEQWKKWDIRIEQIEISEGPILNRKLFRISLPKLDDANMDDIFAQYNHARVVFSEETNPIAMRFNNGMRHASFGGSDMTLMTGEHLDAFRRIFFSDSKATLLDLNKNFNSWADELYSCNMWADADLKQLINPYYTDNMLNNLAQNTHQLRNNISAVHDLGTIVNNKYMNAEYILKSSGVLTDIPIWEQRKKIVDQLTTQKQHLCRITVDKHNRLKVIDYTPRLKMRSTNNDFFKNILENTVMLDEGMMATLSDWSKSTTMALKLQAPHSKAAEWFSTAYNLYKKTIRNGTITWYLYGSRGTGVRNAVDSSTKGLNEVLQFNQDVDTYIKKYVQSISDVNEYSNIYRQIEADFGTVNRETVAKYFAGNTDGLNKFNIIYGYEHTLGGDSVLTEVSLKETRKKAVDDIIKKTGLSREAAEDVRKTFDSVYNSHKFYAMTNDQIQKHFTEIHDMCMDKLKKTFKEGVFSDDELETISQYFWNYRPTVASWGDVMTQYPVLKQNKRFFNNAEVRARLAVYETFLEGGASEYEAMKHVTATQFHYAGIGKVEDFMPFTQYKLYNALYWFDHANARAVSTAWRAAQANGDGYMTNQEIATLITKYNQKKYYIYDAGADSDYDEFYENKLNVAGHILLDGVDSYLGVPRSLNVGNIDLDGTHYLKLGNSFVEELDLITSIAVGAVAFGATIKEHISTGADTAEKLRLAYESIKYTPLYDSFYSPWKSYIDLIAFSYDNKRTGKLDSKSIWENYEAFMANKSTHSEAIAALPVVGAILSNMVGRWKSFDLNVGELAALMTDPDAKTELYNYVKELLCDTTGMLIPSVVGTKVEPDTVKNPYQYARTLSKNYLVSNPTTYFDIIGRLQKEMGFDKDQAQAIWDSMKTGWELGSYRSKLDYYSIAKELYARGFTEDEILNLFEQQKLPDIDNKRFLAMSQSLPNYLKYDKDMRNNIISYYKALGYSTDAAWAKLMSNPSIFQHGKLIELSNYESAKLSKQHDDTYWALHSTEWDDADWKAYWDTMRELGHYYPKGKWRETREYLMRAGYTFDEACAMLLHGYMLDDNGKLVDAQGKARAYAFSYNTLKGAEWDAYWNTVPDYTKYEKGAFGRTMKALKKMGYDDATARALIQQGIYVDKNGNMMNVTGMQRPVLGYPSFNAYYQTIPDYCKYEKGAFKRTYAALKQLGFNYDTNLRLIQQGAYLMDISAAPSIIATMFAQQTALTQKERNKIVVKDIGTLLQKYGATVIKGADGKPYVLIDCSGLQRPRKSFGYSRRGYGGRRGGRGRGRGYSKKQWINYPKKSNVPKFGQYFMRKPFVTQGNVSTFNGFTNFRGSNKLAKPYTTGNAVSTYSLQNFLNGASYGMRKTYKIDMRQYKTGAMSTKSAYPASYRNIAVAYRHNLYKDMYAKYGASRIMMRANQPGYSNASIVRLRRNEIANRERYAERRDLVSKINSGRIKKASR